MSCWADSRVCRSTYSWSQEWIVFKEGCAYAGAGLHSLKLVKIAENRRTALTDEVAAGTDVRVRLFAETV